MTFQPFVPVGGLAGWRYLNATLDVQRAAHGAGRVQTRDLDDFAARIADIETPEALVADYRLLKVALGAFGLDADIGAKHLIRTVLAEGTDARDALANRLSDKRYREFSRAFGFADADGPRTADPGFAERIAARYREERFEVALGETDDTLRLALNARGELSALAEGPGSDLTKWFSILGTPPLRAVLEGAFGLPTSFGALDVDRQVDELRARSASILGVDTVAELGSPETLERLLDRYTAIAGLRDASQVTSPALMLLRGF
jgi:hypothetical protein